MASPTDPVVPLPEGAQDYRSGAGSVAPRPEIGRQRPLPLGGGIPPENLPALPGRGRSPGLWLAVRLPWLAFESLSESVASSRPLAVVSEENGRHIVYLPNAPAMEAGVQPLQTLSAALALVPGLCTRAREPRREQVALESLGEWAGRFSPLVSLEPPDTLLLEIRGSLRLFRGLDRLCRLVSEGVKQRGHRALLCTAPAPLAALWLSRDSVTRLERAEELSRHLNPLSLRVTGWPDKVLAALDGIGVHTLGECRRLPREGFARRFGREYLRDLDRAFGHAPDPRHHFASPVRFADQLELGEESLDRGWLLEGCYLLLHRLEAFLLHHQRVARRLRFRFFHLHQRTSVLSLGFSEPGRDTTHWRDVLETRLEGLRLPAPVIAIGLTTGRLELQCGHTADLPLLENETGIDSTALPRLVEHLRARLGEGAVQGLRTLAEHRPQYAWETVDPLCAAPGLSGEYSPWCRLEEVPEGIRALRYSGSLLLQRPLWMLSRPQRLILDQGRPCHNGPLELLAGPERIETGWWDGADTARDYYVAGNPQGIRLWIYRERRAGADWYLQGIFG